MPTNSPWAPGRRLQRDPVEPGDLAPGTARAPRPGRQEALHGRRWRERMHVDDARQARRDLVQLGVVLHRARAERVEARIDAVVPLREPREVAHHVDLETAPGSPRCRRGTRRRGALAGSMGGTSAGSTGRPGRPGRERSNTSGSSRISPLRTGSRHAPSPSAQAVDLRRPVRELGRAQIRSWSARAGVEARSSRESRDSRPARAAHRDARPGPRPAPRTR